MNYRRTNHEDSLPSFVRQSIDQALAENHHQMIAVLPEEEDMGDEILLPFVYTVGMYRQGLPELLCIGNFNPMEVGHLLNFLCQRMRENGAPLKDREFVGGVFPVLTRLAGDAAKACYTLQTTRYFGHVEYAVQQVILTDPHGHSPECPACDPNFKVPLL